MFIRKVESRNSVCFQIGRKHKGKFVLIKHVGCASSEPAIEVLAIKARETLSHLKFDNQLALFPRANISPRAKLLSWQVTGFHQVFGSVYDAIGFPPGLLRDLVVARIVYPKSKLATIRYLSRYLGINLSKDKVYRFLDKLDKEKLTKVAYRFVCQRNAGPLSLLFYDVTTLYFETDREDNLRQKGYSKDKRTDVPQILVGLFVDQDGYPIDFDFFQGKTFEGHTFQEAITNLIKKYSLETFTIVADAGMLSKDNLDFIASRHLGYIVAARLKNLSQELTQKILAHDFLTQPTYETFLKDKDRRLIVDFSLQRAKKDKANRERLIRSLKLRLIKGQTVIRKSKYLAVSQMGKVKGIDQTKIKEDLQFDGLKGYFTNVNAKELPAEEVIKQYHNLWQVEKAFRMSKGDLKERPIYHYREERIQAHLLLCFISLLVMTETERKLKAKGFSLEKTIELLGKVGQGKIKLEKIELEIDSEVDQKTKSILDLFSGH